MSKSSLCVTEQFAPMTVPECRQLPYLESVILETLRLRPPAYIVGRCASQADNLAGFQVQPGECLLRHNLYHDA